MVFHHCPRTLPLAIFGPANYGYRLGLIGAPARMAQAAAPLAFGVLTDLLGGKVLFVSSALSLIALLALMLLPKRTAVPREDRASPLSAISSTTAPMEDDSGPGSSFGQFVRWATTPPRAYLTYLIVLILVWAVSFYAGTLSPKKAPPPAAPGPVIAPHN